MQNLLANEEVLEEVENPHHSCDNVLRDICDGEFVRNHPLFSFDHKALQIIGYYDDVEICNPIGFKSKKHKIGTMGNIYCILCNCVLSFPY